MKLKKAHLIYEKLIRRMKPKLLQKQILLKNKKLKLIIINKESIIFLKKLK